MIVCSFFIAHQRILLPLISGGNSSSFFSWYSNQLTESFGYLVAHMLKTSLIFALMSKVDKMPTMCKLLWKKSKVKFALVSPPYLSNLSNKLNKIKTWLNRSEVRFFPKSDHSFKKDHACSFSRNRYCLTASLTNSARVLKPHRPSLTIPSTSSINSVGNRTVEYPSSLIYPLFFPSFLNVSKYIVSYLTQVLNSYWRMYHG